MRHETLTVSFGGVPVGMVEITPRQGMLRFNRHGVKMDLFMRDAVRKCSASLCARTPSDPVDEVVVDSGELAFMIAMGILIEMKSFGMITDTGGGLGVVRASDAEATRAYVDIWTKYAGFVRVPKCVPFTRAELLATVNDYVSGEKPGG